MKEVIIGFILLGIGIFVNINIVKRKEEVYLKSRGVYFRIVVATIAFIILGLMMILYNLDEI